MSFIFVVGLLAPVSALVPFDLDTAQLRTYSENYLTETVFAPAQISPASLVTVAPVSGNAPALATSSSIELPSASFTVTTTSSSSALTENARLFSTVISTTQLAPTSNTIAPPESTADTLESKGGLSVPDVASFVSKTGDVVVTDLFTDVVTVSCSTTSNMITVSLPQSTTSASIDSTTTSTTYSSVSAGSGLSSFLESPIVVTQLVTNTVYVPCTLSDHTSTATYATPHEARAVATAIAQPGVSVDYVSTQTETVTEVIASVVSSTITTSVDVLFFGELSVATGISQLTTFSAIALPSSLSPVASLQVSPYSVPPTLLPVSLTTSSLTSNMLTTVPTLSLPTTSSPADVGVSVRTLPLPKLNPTPSTSVSFEHVLSPSILSAVPTQSLPVNTTVSIPNIPILSIETPSTLSNPTPTLSLPTLATLSIRPLPPISVPTLSIATPTFSNAVITLPSKTLYCANWPGSDGVILCANAAGKVSDPSTATLVMSTVCAILMFI